MLVLDPHWWREHEGSPFHPHCARLKPVAGLTLWRRLCLMCRMLMPRADRRLTRRATDAAARPPRKPQEAWHSRWEGTLLFF